MIARATSSAARLCAHLVVLVAAVAGGLRGGEGPPAQEDLFQAVIDGDADAVGRILERGTDPDVALRCGLTALQTARILGDTVLVALLTEKGADAAREVPPADVLVDRLFTDAASRDSVDGMAPGLAVLVSRGGEVLLRKGYGLASIDPKVAVTSKTKFRIGSVTKQFTAAAILKLEEKGKLRVGDRLTKFFPDFPRGDEVTLHHLLTHTSGIHSYTSKPEFLERVTAPTTPDALIEWFRDDPYDFAPGERMLYNNSGYFLLGRIIEKASGLSYAKFLRREFFEPLEMDDTGVYQNGKELDGEAIGLSFDEGRLERAVNWDMSWAGGAGALYSTVEDLHRWNEGLFGGKVLEERSLKVALTPVELPEGSGGMSYGYGLAIGELRGAREIAHGGGLHGFLSQLARYPDEDLTVVVLGNCSPPPPHMVPAALAYQAAQSYLWKKLKPREKVTVRADSESWDDFVGRYDYSSAVMTVSREGDRLFAQLGGQPKYRIYPRAENEFFWKVVEASVTFVKDEKGRVTHARHSQNGAVFDAPRLEERKAVAVDPKIYDDYVGKYAYPGGAVLDVSRDGSRLFARLTGQPRFEIFPASETKFHWKVVEASVTFVKDEKGNVVEVIHEQAGRKFTAPRK